MLARVGHVVGSLGQILFGCNQITAAGMYGAFVHLNIYTS